MSVVHIVYFSLASPKSIVDWSIPEQRSSQTYSEADIIACQNGGNAVPISYFRGKGLQRCIFSAGISRSHLVSTCRLQHCMNVEFDCALLFVSLVLQNSRKRRLSMSKNLIDTTPHQRSTCLCVLKCLYIPLLSLPPPPAGKPSQPAPPTSTPPSSTASSQPASTAVPPAHLGSPAAPTSSSTTPPARPKRLVSGRASGASRKWTGGKRVERYRRRCRG